MERRKAAAIEEAQARILMSQEIADARQKLQHTIENVFKNQLECGVITDPIKIENSTKLRNLERILINRFGIGNEKITEANDTAANLSDHHDEDNSLLVLSGLDLTEDSLENFSIENLYSVSLVNFDKQTLASRCLKIMTINLNKNKLRSIPNRLIDLFGNLEVLDLSGNHFEALYLKELSRFVRLRELNLSNNYLKLFAANKQEDDDLMSSYFDHHLNVLDGSTSSLFFTVEHLNLSNNKLAGSNCIIISQFRNLK